MFFDWLEEAAARQDAIAFLALVAVLVLVMALMYAIRQRGDDKTDDSLNAIIGVLGSTLEQFGKTLQQTSETLAGVAMTLKEVQAAATNANRANAQILVEMQRGSASQKQANEDVRAELVGHNAQAAERFETLLASIEDNKGVLNLIPNSLQAVVNRIDALDKDHQATRAQLTRTQDGLLTEMQRIEVGLLALIRDANTPMLAQILNKLVQIEARAVQAMSNRPFVEDNAEPAPPVLAIALDQNEKKEDQPHATE